MEISARLVEFSRMVGRTYDACVLRARRLRMPDEPPPPRAKTRLWRTSDLQTLRHAVENAASPIELKQNIATVALLLRRTPTSCRGMVDRAEITPRYAPPARLQKSLARTRAIKRRLLSRIARRASTAEDLADGFHLPAPRVKQYLHAMIEYVPELRYDAERRLWYNAQRGQPSETDPPVYPIGKVPPLPPIIDAAGQRALERRAARRTES